MNNKEIKKECELILKNNPRFFWLGNIAVVEKVYSGLDISSSSSFGEGFSNSIAEAMSCELPCVVTDVGDNAFIVGDLGIVVEADNVDALVNALEIMIESDYRQIGLTCRRRILDNFTTKTMVENTQRSIEEVL